MADSYYLTQALATLDSIERAVSARRRDPTYAGEDTPEQYHMDVRNVVQLYCASIAAAAAEPLHTMRLHAVEAALVQLDSHLATGSMHDANGIRHVLGNVVGWVHDILRNTPPEPVASSTRKPFDPAVAVRDLAKLAAAIDKDQFGESRKHNADVARSIALYIEDTQPT